MDQYLIQVSQEDHGLFMATVLRHGTSEDRREGPWAVIMGMAVGSDRDDVIYDAVNNSFFGGEK